MFGYRIVTVWSARGDTRLARQARVAAYVQAAAATLLTLLVFGCGVSLSRVFLDGATLSRALGPPTPVVLTILAALVLLAAIAVCRKIRGRHQGLSKSPDLAPSAASAFAYARAAVPALESSPTVEHARAWLHEFRKLSQDMVLVDPGTAQAIGPPGEHDARPQVTIASGSRVAAYAVGAGVGVLAFVVLGWVGRLTEGGLPTVFHTITGLALGGGALALALRWQRRISGPLTFDEGVMRHGGAAWRPSDSIIAVRRSWVLFAGWYRIDSIGDAGAVTVLLPDTERNRQVIRNAISLWLVPTARRAASACREAGFREVASLLGLPTPDANVGTSPDRWPLLMLDVPGMIRPESDSSHVERMALGIAAILSLWAGPLSSGGGDGDFTREGRLISLRTEMSRSSDEDGVLHRSERNAIERLASEICPQETERAALYAWLDLRAKSLVRRQWPEIERAASRALQRRSMHS